MENGERDFAIILIKRTEVEGGLLLNIIVRKCASVLKLLASEDQALLIGRNALLVLDLGLHVVNCIGGFDLKGDCLPSKSLDENLHTTAKTQNEVEGGLLLNIIIRKGAAVLKLLASENQTLLVGRDAFFVLDLRLHIVDRVRRLNLEGDCLTREGLDKDLHTATETEDKVKSRLLLDIVIRKGAPVLELLSSENQTLLIGGDPARR